MNPIALVLLEDQLAIAFVLKLELQPPVQDPVADLAPVLSLVVEPLVQSVEHCLEGPLACRDALLLRVRHPLACLLAAILERSRAPEGPDASLPQALADH